MKTQFKLGLTALAVAQCLNISIASAQEAADADKQADIGETEVITVRGFGSTLTRSLQHKKLADSTVEIISTDDLGQLPDVTITDALARLPGIAADRDRGNASQISIRGMGPRLNLATMNGREIVSGEPSRSVRFEQFPAELISSVEVFKSPLASNIEGGISGLVNMQFVEPLTKDERAVNISGHLMSYPLADDIPTADSQGYRANFSYIDPISDTFGIAFGVAVQDQPSLQKDVTSWEYNNVPAEQGDVNGNGISEAAPWGAQTATKGGDNQRVGAMTVLQWLPNESLELKYDLFYSKFDIEEREDQVWFDGWGNWGGLNNWNISNASNPPQIITKPDGSEQIVSGGMLWGGSHTANNSTWFQKNELVSTGLNAEWLGDVWKVNADIGYSEASITSRWVNIQSWYWDADADANGMDYSWDTTTDRLSIGTGYDISDATDYGLNYMQVDNDRLLEDEMITAKLDFARPVEWGIIDAMSFGGRWTDREKDNDVVSWQQSVANSSANVDAFTYELGEGYGVPALYSIKNWSEVAQEAFGGIDNRNQHTQTNADILNSWNVQETNTALYVQFNLLGEIGGISYTGNVGVRYISTESTSSGFQQADGGELTAVSIDHDYSEVLPALNLRFDITEDSQIRFGLSRAISRPPLIEMRTGLQLNTSSTVNTASGGNPQLNPFIADQVDLGYEYFFAEDAALTVSLFFKDLKSHVGAATDTLNINGESYQFTGPVNGDGGQIRGVEVMYQQAFNMLPEPFDGLGIYTNYSYTDTNVTEFEPENNPLTMGGLSKNVGSLTLWYYKAGIDAKVSYNYRSAYTSVGSWDPGAVFTIDDEATVDASIAYEVTENFKVMLQGQNLTNEASTSYFDNDPTRPRQYAEWGRRYLLGFQYAM